MRTELKALAGRVRKLQEAGSPEHVVRDVRNSELAKIMNTRREHKNQLLKDCELARERVKEIFAELLELGQIEGAFLAQLMGQSSLSGRLHRESH